MYMCLKPDDIFRIVTHIVKKLHILLNQSVYYHVQKSPLLLPILSQMNPLHTIPHHPICLRTVLTPFSYLYIDFIMIPFLQIF